MITTTVAAALAGPLLLPAGDIQPVYTLRGHAGAPANRPTPLPGGI